MVTVALLEPKGSAPPELVRALASALDVRRHRSMEELRGSSPDVIVIHVPDGDVGAADVAALRRAHPRSLVLIALPGDVGTAAHAPALAAVVHATAGASPDEEPMTAAAAAVRRLTPIERHILKMIADGLTNPEIALHLNLASQTVKNYVSALFTKLGVSRRTEAAVLFVRASMSLVNSAGLAQGEDDSVAVLMRELHAGIDRMDRIADRIAASENGPRREHSMVPAGSRSTRRRP